MTGQRAGRMPISPTSLITPHGEARVAQTNGTRRSGLAGRPFAGRRLRGGKPGDRHPERRARDIVEPDLVTEGDRARVAAMLAADADLEVAGGRPPAPAAGPD